ncbi:Hypothetical_protein [Hexamita inflata]|uniref:Hypothetical_protein n=1 Tax=Hexamita inflata TaxID=28002 RepID=A0AA86PRM9_9EUKA|nr:Hypothetical protein HINF_LOCUS29843 [Hexamita inflata]
MLDRQIMDCLSQLLQIQSCPIKVSFYVLMLPDHLYSCLIRKVSYLLETPENNIFELFQIMVLNHFIYSTPKHIITNRNYNLVVNTPRTQSQESIQFQNMFAQCLQKVLHIQESDNKQLSQIVLSYLEQNSSKQFWKQMHEQNKVILQKLINNMKDKKASEIAEQFMEMTKNRNYFKRNVLMYIVNMKTK